MDLKLRFPEMMHRRGYLIVALLIHLSWVVKASGAANETSPVRVACVGDSITAGAGAPKGKSYPAQLQEILGSGWEVKNFGVRGRTMLKQGDHPYWKEKAFKQAQDFKPNVVIIMLGTNDSKPLNWAHGDEFIGDYRDMVKVFQTLESKPRIYLCHVPEVVEPNKYKISETVSVVICQRVDALAKEMGLDVIAMDQAYGGDVGVLGSDKVHPNEKGALELAQTAAKALSGTQAAGASH